MRSCNIPIMFLTLLAILLMQQVNSQEDYEFNADGNNHNSTYLEVETARKRRKTSRYVVPILLTALMIKSIIFPLAFKAMAVMSSVAVLLSTMSLIISSIVGYVKTAVKGPSTVKVVHKPGFHWAKDDDNSVKNYYTLDATEYDHQGSSGGREQLFNGY